MLRLIRLLPLVGLLLACLMAGCVIDSVPLPEADPDQALDRDGQGPNTAGGPGTDDAGDNVTDPDTVLSQAWVDLSAVYFAGNPLRIVGVTGAVPAGVAVLLEDFSSSSDSAIWRTSVTASALGGFYALTPDAAFGDRITMGVLDADGMLVSSAVLHLVSGSVEASGSSLNAAGTPSDGQTPDAADPPPVFVAAGVAVLSPNGEGYVYVGGGPGTVVSGLAVVVVNTSNGDATIAYAAYDGSFSTLLSAHSSDKLEMFAVEPASNNGGGPILSVTVP